MGKTSRNSVLTPGIMRLSRSAVYKKKGVYKRKHTAIAKKAAAVAATTKTVQVSVCDVYPLWLYCHCTDDVALSLSFFSIGQG